MKIENALKVAEAVEKAAVGLKASIAVEVVDAMVVQLNLQFPETKFWRVGGASVRAASKNAVQSLRPEPVGRPR
jgi:hypothetical protein